MMPTVVVPGRPIPKGRPRLGVRGRSVYVYTPPETVAYEQTVGYCARTVFPEPLQGPVALRLRFYFRRGLRPDLDNCVKAICDGLNKVAWHDDKQVVYIEAQLFRCRAGDERVEIEVTEAQEAAEGA